MRKVGEITEYLFSKNLTVGEFLEAIPFLSPKNTFC